jgi:pantoate--beta-alanine ligase
VLVVATASELREHLTEWRHNGEHIALVPTMGNLHDGHLGLVELAREHAERVVVSIFVNPTQFEPGADFDDYPRSLRMDQRRLKLAEADLLFVPEVDTMYPFGTNDATVVSVPALTKDLCGTFRPGHFDGVTSVVARLFCLVMPDVAIFGQKDFQQQLVIRRMTADLGLPVRIVSAPTRREADGLAQSSRNRRGTSDRAAAVPQPAEDNARLAGRQTQFPRTREQRDVGARGGGVLAGIRQHPACREPAAAGPGHG